MSSPTTPASIEAYLRAAPKAELHVHLEGSIRPATLLQLAQRNGVDLPARDLGGLREWFRYRDFDHFVEIYIEITRCLRNSEDYELIAYEFGAEMASQNIRYAEVTFSPSTHHALGVAQDVWFGGLSRGRERARAEFDVEIAWVFDIVRNVPGPEDNRERADYTVGVAIEGMRDGVVALGLGGVEVGYPPEPFAPYFERALAAGLHSVPHAGETVGPPSVWGCAQGAEGREDRPRSALHRGPRAGSVPCRAPHTAGGLPYQQHPARRIPEPVRAPAAPLDRGRCPGHSQLR